MTTTGEWYALLAKLLDEGRVVSPLSAGAAWRGRTSHEILGHQTRVPMAEPLVLSGARKLSHRFACADAAWIASGDNRVATIAPYSKVIKHFSDDGVRFFGAYGPKFVEQLSFVTSTLRADASSRQAVINVWREQPRATADTPCTLSLQFMIRDGRLECVATMRSSDAWTGIVYDWFSFSVMAAVVTIELRATRSKGVLSALEHLALGDLRLTAGSQHLYELDRAPALTVLENRGDAEPYLAPLDLAEFRTGQDLIDHLWRLARGEPTDKRWLVELFRLPIANKVEP